MCLHPYERDRLEADGFIIREHVVNAADVASILASLSVADAEAGQPVQNRHPSRRNLLRNENGVVEIAGGALVRGLAESVLGRAAFPVRAILFDKVPGANWKVGWHQDLIIPVKERRDAPGFSGWSVKEGVPHAHPPQEVLAGMLTVRLHLDDCTEDNGPLRVIPGSHRGGYLSNEEIQSLRTQTAAVTCVVPRGGALLMRPLLVHASSPAAQPGHRRVLHLEFAAKSLPHGLEWGLA